MFPFLAAVFLSAFLLFLVQPLMGRFVLPWFGGSSAVWTACLLFFQTALLAGYAYAHALTRWLPTRRQAILHGGLLLGVVLWLPPLPDAAGSELKVLDASVWQVIRLLTQVIGLPFVVLAATGPLLQRWFSELYPERSVYRLYALSNAGSLLALLSYPVLVEPNVSRAHQAWIWSGLFGVFALIAGVLIWRLQRVRSTGVSRPLSALACEVAPPISRPRQLYWIACAAIASGLLAATTNALTLDVASVPFLWILPLAIYLLSFIITFDHSRWYRRPILLGLLPLAAAASLEIRDSGSAVSLGVLMAVHLIALAVGGVVCHGELYRTRPATSDLTRFYLSIAAGGAAGTFGVALVSPRLFPHDIDLPLLWLALLSLVAVKLTTSQETYLARCLVAGQVLALAAVPLLVVPTDVYLGRLGELARANVVILAVAIGAAVPIFYPWKTGRATGRNRFRSTHALLILVAVLGWHVLGQALTPDPGTLATRRSFFGELKVVDYRTDDERGSSRFMAHGNTTHGIQLLHPDYRRYPTSYYSLNSGIGRALSRSNQSRNRQIGVVGLGVGTVASYGMAGDRIRFYEIDAQVADLANRYFTFLSDSPAKIEIRIGDGRRLIETENRERTHPPLDLLIVDAFSSDAVPVHLLTREAMAAYVARLAPDGVIVVNISNRLVDLRPVLEAHAGHFGLYLAHILNRPEVDDWWDFSSEWMLLAPRRDSLDTPRITELTELAEPGALTGLPWTDEFASLWSVLR